MRITVVGTHSWSLAPERGTVHVTVDLEGSDRAATNREVAGTVDALGRDLHRLRLGDAAPVTWYTIGPLVTRTWRPYGDRGQVLPPRHGASVTVRARFRDFAVLAEATGAWAERAGVQISHVEWDLTDATRAGLESTSLARAVEASRARALAIAQAAGWTDVEVEEVADPGLLGGPGAEPPQPFPVARQAFALEADRGVAPLSPEDVRGETLLHARFRAVR